MKKILAHVCKDKTYLPLLQELGSKIEVASGSLHESIFDNYHKYKPTTVILPIHEYTQEFHEFVESFRTQTQIIIFAGSLTDNAVTEYCDQKNIQTICHNKFGKHILGYDHLYDSEIYKTLGLPKINKILTILSKNNDYNHKMLDKILYPNSMRKLVLINNPEFKHEQNIGSAELKDLSVLMNHYEYAIDLTKSYYAELQACNTKTIVLEENNLADNIDNNVFVPQDNDIEKYSIKNFVSDKLLSFIHEEERA